MQRQARFPRKSRPEFLDQFRVEIPATRRGKVGVPRQAPSAADIQGDQNEGPIHGEGDGAVTFAGPFPEKIEKCRSHQDSDIFDEVVGIHLDAPKPIMQRVDPADTGLPRGLALVARDENYPFTSSFYSHRFGFGVGNRLNGVVMELGTGGSYTVPTAYA